MLELWVSAASCKAAVACGSMYMCFATGLLGCFAWVVVRRAAARGRAVCGSDLPDVDCVRLVFFLRHIVDVDFESQAWVVRDGDDTSTRSICLQIHDNVIV